MICNHCIVIGEVDNYHYFATDQDDCVAAAELSYMPLFRTYNAEMTMALAGCDLADARHAITIVMLTKSALAIR